jgi:ABC-type amino acid transport substrate-binding protein
MMKNFLFLFLLLSSFQSPLSAEPSPVQVGADIDYAPFSFLKNGSPAGFDIEFFEMLAGRLSVSARYGLLPWHEVHKQAKQGDFDIVLGLLYSPEREMYMDFTVPYNTIQMSLVVPKESSIRAPSEIAGKTMAYLKNDVLPELLLENLHISVQKNRYDTLTEALHSVSTGESDFCITPSEFIRVSMQKNEYKNLRVINSDRFTAAYQIGVTESGKKLLKPLNTAIKQLLKSNRYQRLKQKWSFSKASRESGGNGTDSIPAVLFGITAAFILGCAVTVILLKKKLEL